MSLPYYAIGAWPTEPTRVRGFFKTGTKSPQWALTEAHRFRTNGWDTYTGDFAKLVDGRFLEVRRGDTKLLRLYRDGTLLFRVRADSEFLTRGANRYLSDGFLFLNPLAVVESHASFIALYARIVSYLESPPSKVALSMRFNGTEILGSRLALTQNLPGGHYVIEPEPYPLADVDASTEIQVDAETLVKDLPRAAYQVVAHFFDQLFDAPPTLVPFTRQMEGGPVIDFSRLRSP